MQYINLLTSGIKTDVGNSVQVHQYVRLKNSKCTSSKYHRCWQYFPYGEKEVWGLQLHQWLFQPHSGCVHRKQEVTGCLHSSTHTVYGLEGYSHCLQKHLALITICICNGINRWKARRKERKKKRKKEGKRNKDALGSGQLCTTVPIAEFMWLVKKWNRAA